MATGFEDWAMPVFTSASEEEQIKVTVTDSETEVTFTKEVKSWRIYNDGPSAVHYSLNSGVSTDNFKIPPRAGLVEDVPTSKIYLICPRLYRRFKVIRKWQCLCLDGFILRNI